MSLSSLQGRKRDRRSSLILRNEGVQYICNKHIVWTPQAFLCIRHIFQLEIHGIFYVIYHFNLDQISFSQMNLNINSKQINMQLMCCEKNYD